MKNFALFYSALRGELTGQQTSALKKFFESLDSATSKPSTTALKITDVGGGSGTISRSFPDHNILTLDINPEMKKTYLSKGGDETNFLLDDFLNLEFISNIEPLVLDVYRILAQGSSFICSFEELCETSPEYPKANYLNPFGGFVHFRRTKPEVTSLLESAGFEIESVSSINGYFSPTAKTWVKYLAVKAIKP